MLWIFFLRFYLFIFRERGREGEREGEKHQCVVASRAPPTGHLACNPTGNRTSNSLVCRPVLNPSHGNFKAPTRSSENSILKPVGPIAGFSNFLLIFSGSFPARLLFFFFFFFNKSGVLLSRFQTSYPFSWTVSVTNGITASSVQNEIHRLQGLFCSGKEETRLCHSLGKPRQQGVGLGEVVLYLGVPFSW